MAAKQAVKREYSAGGVVFKKEAKKILWLIIQPKADSEHWRKGRWQLPKGWIDKGETGSQAASREVKEEGGVEAKIVEKVGRINIFFFNEEKQRVAKNIVFFLMEFQRETKEGPDHRETAKLAWLNFGKARQQLTFDSEKEILTKAKKILEEKERQQSLF